MAHSDETKALRKAKVKAIAGVLHARHVLDDARPLRGYAHCECLSTAQDIYDVLAAQFGRSEAPSGG